eukprot:Sspe_Gene.98627::Locus_72030_Transcript_1_1_Confidence_1.000_Length_2113::g.98627::m.98627
MVPRGALAAHPVAAVFRPIPQLSHLIHAARTVDELVAALDSRPLSAQKSVARCVALAVYKAAKVGGEGVARDAVLDRMWKACPDFLQLDGSELAWVVWGFAKSRHPRCPEVLSRAGEVLRSQGTHGIRVRNLLMVMWSYTQCPRVAPPVTVFTEHYALRGWSKVAEEMWALAKLSAATKALFVTAEPHLHLTKTPMRNVHKVLWACTRAHPGSTLFDLFAPRVAASMGGPFLPHILSSYAAVRYVPANIARRLVEYIGIADLHLLPTRSLSCYAFALAVLGSPLLPIDEALRGRQLSAAEHVALLCAFSQGGHRCTWLCDLPIPPHLTPSQAASVLRAFATVRAAPRDDVLDTLDRTVSSSPSSPPRALANSLWSFVRLTYRDSLVKHRITAGKLWYLSLPLRDLAEIVAGLASLRHALPCRPLLSLLVERLSSLVRTSRQHDLEYCMATTAVILRRTERAPHELLCRKLEKVLLVGMDSDRHLPFLTVVVRRMVELSLPGCHRVLHQAFFYVHRDPVAMATLLPAMRGFPQGERRLCERLLAKAAVLLERLSWTKPLVLYRVLDACARHFPDDPTVPHLAQELAGRVRKEHLSAVVRVALSLPSAHDLMEPLLPRLVDPSLLDLLPPLLFRRGLHGLSLPLPLPTPITHLQDEALASGA